MTTMDIFKARSLNCRTGQTLSLVLILLFSSLGQASAQRGEATSSSLDGSEPIGIYVTPDPLPWPEDGSLVLSDPPNYFRLDSTVFLGTPSSEVLSSRISGGYFVYFEEAVGWTIAGRASATGDARGQFHGSIVAQLDAPPEFGVNVVGVGFELSGDLSRNDRWGYTELTNVSTPGLYEIWWDVTSETGAVSLTVAGEVVDFNLWLADDNVFGPERIYLGAGAVPLSGVPGYVDTYLGIADPYQLSAGLASPNTSIFTGSLKSGASFNLSGEIESGAVYGDSYAGSSVYQGNGIQFSTLMSGTSFGASYTGTVDTFIICPGRQVFDTLTVSVDDPEEKIFFDKLSTLGNFSAIPGVSPVEGYFDFVPDTAGSYVVTFAVKRGSMSDPDPYIFMKTYVIVFNQAPQLIAGDLSQTFCFGGETVTHDLTAIDAESDPLSWSLTFGEGQIDQNGQISFVADTAGTYCFAARVADSCGFAEDTVCVIVTLNRHPELYNYKDTVSACADDTVCFVAAGFDRNYGDVINIVLTSDTGWFQMTTDTSGVTCFVPGYLDTATTFIFKYKLTDDCIRASQRTAGSQWFGQIEITVEPKLPPLVTLVPDYSLELCQPAEVCVEVAISDPDDDIVSVTSNLGPYDPLAGTVCFLGGSNGGADTLIVTAVDACGAEAQDTVVISYTSLELDPVYCPNDTSIFICDTGDVRIAFGIFSAGTTVSVRPSSAWYDSSTGQIVFFTNCSVDKQLTVIVSNGCQTDTCVFTAFVTLNSPPLVIGGPAQDTSFCAPDYICWPVGISDADNNIKDIIVTTPGSFNPLTGKVCYPADSSGNYTVVVTVTDDCGAVSNDTLVAQVTVNSVPEIVAGADLSLSLCGPQEICLSFVATDPDGPAPAVTPNFGAYNDLSRTFCFTPDTAGIYTLIAVATDECGATAVDTALMTVSFNSAPEVSLGADTTLALCALTEICLPVNLPQTAGNENIASVIPDVGYYNSFTHEVCFTPSSAGEYPITVTVTDDCGLVAVDSILITVTVEDVGDWPLCLVDTRSLTICGSDSAFYTVSGSFGSTVVNVVGGRYENGVIAFAVDTSGRYTVNLSASTACSSYDCDYVFDVTVGELAELTCPTDTSLFACAPGTKMYIPIGLMADSASISVTPIGYYQNGLVCFDADTAGVYTISIVATTICGSDSCQVQATVTLNSPPVVIGPADTTIYICSSEKLYFTFDASDVDGNLRSISTTSGYISNDTVCFTAGGSGVWTIVLTAMDSCSQVDADTSLITVIMNTPPSIVLGADSSVVLCVPEEICVAVNAGDIDGNIESVIVSGGVYVNGQLCFTPDTAGLYTLIATVTDSCGASASDTALVSVSLNATPRVFLKGATDTSLCAPVELCCTVTIDDDNPATVTTNWGIYDPVTRKVCFTPDSSGLYEIILTVTDSCGVDGADTALITVTLNNPPTVVSSADTVITGCEAGTVCFPVNVFDADGNIVSTVVTGGVNAVFANGEVCFDPAGAGVYQIVTTVTDSCSLSASDTTTVTIIANSAPEVAFATDSLLLNCVTSEVCLPINISDIDGNLADIQALNATINTAGDSICFTPGGDGSLAIIVTATDSCGLSTADTLMVVITNGVAFSLQCPPDTSVFICEPDTLCFALAGVPVEAEVQVSPPSVYFDRESGSLCFYTNCSVVKDISVIVTSGCFVDTCVFTANVTMNSVPLVISAPDLAEELCGPQDVCFPVGISDADGNLDFVQVVPVGSYNPISGMVCVPIDTAGIYLIVTTAVDSCGARDSDSTYINATLNLPPTVSAPAELDLFQCLSTEICVPVQIGDPDGNIFMVNSSLGSYDPVTSEVCFTAADSGGVYVLVTTVIDSCGLLDTDTTVVTVRMNSKPELLVPLDTSFTVCAPGETCIPIRLSDPEGNLMDALVSSGAWYQAGNNGGGIVCFAVGVSGVYEIDVTAFDSCGAWVRKTIVAHITVNSAPVVVAAVDTTVQSCALQEVCFSVGISDADGNLDPASVSVWPNGSYNPITGKICLTPPDTGAMAVIISATDYCGLTGADTTWVVANINPSAVITCPSKPINVFLCGPDTVCQMVEISPPEAIVSASFGSFVDGELCFPADTAGIYRIELIASTDCGADTCEIVCVVEQGAIPSFSCPDDTTIFVCGPQTICRPVGVIPSGSVIEVSPIGSYNAGMVCFPVDTSGHYEITISASADCGGDTCVFAVDVVVNTPPTIDPLPDTAIVVCDLGSEEVCLEVAINDPDQAQLSVRVSAPARYDAELGAICFTPGATGFYTLWVRATDQCGARVFDTFKVEIISDEIPLINCPDTLDVVFCETTDYCLLVEVNSSLAVLSADYGSIVGDRTLCLPLDTSGIYTSTVIASNTCGVDTCEVVIRAVLAPEPTVICPEPQYIFSCETATVCVPCPYSPTWADVLVSGGDAYFDSASSSICIPVVKDTSFTIEVLVTVGCDTAICSFEVTTEINNPPVVSVGSEVALASGGDDFTLLLCTFDSVCVPVTISDDEDNVSTIVTNIGAYDPVRGVVCFLPPTVGKYCLEVTATDSCGAQGVDTVCVNITTGVAADIVCPQGLQSASLCSPDNVCLLLPITVGVDSVVTSFGSYDPSSKQLCFFADTAGIYQIDILAYAPCGDDSCRVEVEVEITPTPTLSCPDPIDTLLCVSQVDSFFINIGAVATGSVVEVKPIGAYADGQISFPVDTPGVYQIDVLASTRCGSDSCRLEVIINDNTAPSLTLPTGLMIPRCPTDTGVICLTGIFASDLEGDELTVSKICGPGEFTLIDTNSGQICFLPPSADSVYEFCVQATDGCHTRTESFFVTVYPAADCGVCLTVSIEGPDCTPVGQDVDVRVVVETKELIGGYDILISYDVSVLAFLFADIGEAITGWEYFTYRQGPFGPCASCPNGLLRFVAIADINDGPNHPPSSSLSPQGVLATIKFRVANDQTLGDQFVPISFYWLDCGDNAFSDPGGQLLFVDSRIFNAENNLIWDEFDDDRFPESSRPAGLGASDELCTQGDKGEPIRCIDFRNGGICIINPDSIDARGDINLNGIAYEVADAVVFTNYFIVGITAFKFSVAGQTAATDVNADGATLTVADLVYLVRVIIGDANPIPKVVPGGSLATASIRQEGESFVVSTDASQDVGAALFILEYSGATPTSVTLGDHGAGMDLIYSIKEGVIRVLVYEKPDNPVGRTISSGVGDLLTVNLPAGGAAEVTLVDAQLSDAQGWGLLETETLTKIVPTSFELLQNYPNPFNPVTVIEMALPVRAEWSVTVFNMLGQRVRRFEGQSEAGIVSVTWDGRDSDGSRVASGIYLYSAKAGQYAATKKMLLLK